MTLERVSLGGQIRQRIELTGRAISTDILDILKNVLLKYFAACCAISASLNPTKPIRRLGITWESVTWKRAEKCFPSSSLERVGGSPETNTLVVSILFNLLWKQQQICESIWEHSASQRVQKQWERKKILSRKIIFFFCHRKRWGYGPSVTAILSQAGLALLLLRSRTLLLRWEGPAIYLDQKQTVSCFLICCCCASRSLIATSFQRYILSQCSWDIHFNQQWRQKNERSWRVGYRRHRAQFWQMECIR